MTNLNIDTVRQLRPFVNFLGKGAWWQFRDDKKNLYLVKRITRSERLKLIPSLRNKKLYQLLKYQTAIYDDGIGGGYFDLLRVLDMSEYKKVTCKNIYDEYIAQQKIADECWDLLQDDDLELVTDEEHKKGEGVKS